MPRSSSSIVRFFTGATPAASLAAGLAAALFFALGWAIAHRLLPLLTPPGATLVLTSPAEPLALRARAGFALALPTLLAWIVAATRGARRHSPTSALGLALFGAPILLAAVGAGIARALLVRSLWRPIGAQGAMIPASELIGMGWAVRGALLVTVLFLVAITFGSSPRSGPR